MNRVPNFNYAEVREAAQNLVDCGFEYVDMGTRGHPMFQHPEMGKMSLALTPRNPGRWLYEFRGRLASKLGISRYELELRLGVRQVKRSGPKTKRKRNEAGRAARTFHLYRDEKPRPERVGTVRQRMDAIASEIRALDARMNLATGETYSALLGERVRLRGEYLQLETERETP